VHPLPSWQAETALREVQALPPRQAEKQLCGVRRLPSQQDKTPMCSVQNSTPSSKRIKREPKSSPEIKFEPEIKQ